MSEPDLQPDDSASLATPLCALIATGQGALLLSEEGEVEQLHGDDLRQLEDRWLLTCHTPLTASRLGCEMLQGLDLLELFAFVRPASFCVPTPRGLAQALELDSPGSDEAAALLLWQARAVLLDELAALEGDTAARAAGIAHQMHRGGWRWGSTVLSALGQPAVSAGPQEALAVWSALPEWTEIAPDAPRPATVDQAQARSRLAQILEQHTESEPRPQQSDYASAVSAAFTEPGENVLAEAGTGVGKTLGYLAPALLWAETAGAPVWISTYTRNLQRQIQQETRRLFPASSAERRPVVVRKGRENYLCLLNYEDAVRGAQATAGAHIALGLIARWIESTRDGDLRGGDLPGWLPDLAGRNRVALLADRRGECLHGACPHFRRCFIERSVEAARHAQLVIANHALVMSAAASGGIDEAYPPERFIFDEGHHLFHAADSAFGSDLSGRAGYELRRWFLGGEGRSKGRVRGLFRRAEFLLANADQLQLLEAIRQHAMILPGEDWLGRVERGEGRGPAEQFLTAVRALVMSRDPAVSSAYSIECSPDDLPDAILLSARQLHTALDGLCSSVRALQRALTRRLEDESELDAELRDRIKSLLRTLNHYILEQLTSWQAMLTTLTTLPPADFVDWFGIERSEGRPLDIGLFRRHLDPTQPFIQALEMQARGSVMTSATLTDPLADPAAGWAAAEADCGTIHLQRPALRARVPSPFDYARQTRVLVVTDINSKDEAGLASAYQKLFLAAEGGALGLFTAIERLRRVRSALLAPLARAGLSLYSQHTDGLDPHTLIDIFRAEGNACLLGTDAVRDGVDVPGRALRLIVFDKIPWPRTDLLLRARKAAFGGVDYIERLTRQRLRQAFGRLIRRADDHGVFVLLSPLPSRLASAFPGVTPERVTLAEAVQITRAFLKKS